MTEYEKIIYEIDAEVARVLGLNPYKIRQYWYYEKLGYERIVPGYTRWPEHADRVKKWLLDQQYRIVVRLRKDCCTLEVYGGNDATVVQAKTEPLALCLAVLGEEERNKFIKMLEECDAKE